MATSASATAQKLEVDFHSLKHNCPEGVYVAPHPQQALLWTGVLFVRKGPYANAILRFEIAFSPMFPGEAPTIRFVNDIFHPLVAPLTTYTITARDTGVDTVSAADKQHLPPGGFSLQHGFPEWGPGTSAQARQRSPPHVVEVLQYLRVAFDTEAVLESIPLELAVNAGAWHAWQSFRAKALGHSRSSSAARQSGASEQIASRSQSPMAQQQPGGARRPGDWNWKGVWEDRVRKSIQASTSDPVLFGATANDVINFTETQDEIEQSLPWNLGATQA